MAIHPPTFRHADGERIPGTWRHVFIRNGETYYLSDLIIYADGLVDCWGLVTLEGLAEKLRTGWVATTLQDGAQASAHSFGAWKFSEPHSSLTPELLLGELRDEIDILNHRPDSTQRCLAAAQEYLAEPTPARQSELHAAFLAIPEHMRHYALGDMDNKDRPLRVLATAAGDRLAPGDGPVVTEEMREHALAYFAERAEAITRQQDKTPADGPDQAFAPAVTLDQVFYPKGWPKEPGLLALRNEYPATIRVDETEYPSVTHAYWALSTDDEQHRATIAGTENPGKARSAAEQAPRRPGWEHARTAVMAQLLRAKFAQHPDLARLLLDTEDATMLYNDGGSAHWGQHGLKGRNWVGRLLELIRAELAAHQAGIHL